MNELYARQCLEDNAWNLDAAAVVYSHLKAHDQIPPAAYL